MDWASLEAVAAFGGNKSHQQCELHGAIVALQHDGTEVDVVIDDLVHSSNHCCFLRIRAAC